MFILAIYVKTYCGRRSGAHISSQGSVMSILDIMVVCVCCRGVVADNLKKKNIMVSKISSQREREREYKLNKK